MLKTVTVTFENIEIVLGRPTVADARLRLKIWQGLAEPTTAADTFAFVATQIVSVTGLPDTPAFKRIAVYPGDAEIKALFEEWCAVIDEELGILIRNGVTQLRESLTALSDQKKA